MEMDNMWTRCKGFKGVVIYNFWEEAEQTLRLTVGDVIHIYEEFNDWYRGHNKLTGLVGIFPKSYVHILQNFNNTETLIDETTSVLREWGLHLKSLYQTRSTYFEHHREQIMELIGYRVKILSGTLTKDEAKDIKKLATARIDTGNQLIGLDMVVRDDHGNVLNPEYTSTIQLYYHHAIAAEGIRKANYGTRKKTNKPQSFAHSHIFFVCVRNFVCKMSENVELLLTLYDAKEMRAITENYVVHWTKEGLVRDIEQIHNLRVLFTDLGSGDLSREKVYLVCTVIRVGNMETKEPDRKRLSMIQVETKKNGEGMRRPFGIAAMDITMYMNEKLEGDVEKHHFIPFVRWCEKESLDGTLRRIFAQKETSVQKNGYLSGANITINEGLFVSFKLFKGDTKQVRDENPHFVLGNVAIARKMGFPEVILPGDVRNDLYLTLLFGEFNKGSKSSDKNVEVTIKVCNENGVPISRVITLGGGAPALNEYRSVIYYHEDKPRWCETIKIAVPIEEFKQAHLKFTFKHRSSNEVKDRSEKSFALSHVKLMQSDGTTLKNDQHELLVYKLDQKKYEENDNTYLKLPSTRAEIYKLHIEKKPNLGAFSLTAKDSFSIMTNVCSTKLTEDLDLLGLLNWASQETGLEASLIALMKVKGEEVVKFLQDVLDALFHILMNNSDIDDYDEIIFDCLLYVFGLVSDRKYQHFQPVLDLYISDSFSATLAYKKLIAVLRKRIESAKNYDGQEHDSLLKTMKNLQYCMKFIVQSRLLFSELNNQEEEEFTQSLTELLNSVIDLMGHDTHGTLLVQGACLKYLPTTIPHLLKIHCGKELSKTLNKLLVALPLRRLTKQKMMTVNDIVHSPLFLNADYRMILLPEITKLIRNLLGAKEERLSSCPGKSVAKVARLLGEDRHRLNQHRGYSEEVELCVKILSDILELTFRNDIGPTYFDIKEIMLTVLRTIIQTVITMDRENPLVGNLVSVMLAIFRQMTQKHFDEYTNHFGTNIDLLDFLMEILMVFTDLVSKNVFPPDWSEMIMLQNSVILKSLRYFASKIKEKFFIDFKKDVWSNFFYCAIAFLTQPSLQLETFSAGKRYRIFTRYKDMRRETADEIRSMWLHLGQIYSKSFVPGLVGPILEMGLIPENELRRNAIHIFFEMMKCEYFSPRSSAGHFESRRDDTVKAHFKQFENEMIAQLDFLVGGGKGDEQFCVLWSQVMTELCECEAPMKHQGLIFVKTLANLMNLLLQYRIIINTESQEHRMLCTVNLLEFYSQINRKEMYIRYVNKLCELHLECDNYTEAAYTLKLHGQLLKWSDDPIEPLLRSNRYPLCRTHRDLKEALYHDMIEYFDKGKMWECALRECKELITQYEQETYDYAQLSALMKRMANYYDSIVTQLRPEPEYFRVAYYGLGHPPFLQNKVFVYRGKEYERLIEFRSRTLNQLPNAEDMTKLSPPSQEILESNCQYVQMNKVDPVMDERTHRLSGKPVTAEAVLRYHRVNDVQRFRFSRPVPRKDIASLPQKEKDKDTNNVAANEFASLWLERTVLIISHPLPGVLRCFPVTSSETYLISPLRNAIETMEVSNKSIKDLIMAHRNDAHLPLKPLSMKLTGILDAAVMGGIDNYEKAFLNAEFRNSHPEDSSDLAKLESLIAEQIPLLNVGVQLHKMRAPQEIAPLHQRLEQCFASLRNQVETKYGKRAGDIHIENVLPTVTLRKSNLHRGDHRSTDSSLMQSDNGSLTRSQVTTFKLLSSFNSNNGSPSNVTLSRNGSMRSHILSTSIPKPSSGTLKKKDAKRKSSRKTDLVVPTKIEQPTSQWYTSPEALQNAGVVLTPTTCIPAPKFELRQELISKRPLRSEAAERERRMSSRWSGQSQHFLRGSNNGFEYSYLGKGNRDSIGTTDSTASEDDPPPPLPIKLREADYCNLPESSYEYYVPPRHSSFSKTLLHLPRNKLPIPLDREETYVKPPTPPPKPRRPYQN